MKCPQPPGSRRSSRASPHAVVATALLTPRIKAPMIPPLAADMSSTEPLTGPRKSSHVK